MVMMLTSASANIMSEEQKILRDKVSHEICKDTKSQTGELAAVSESLRRKPLHKCMGIAEGIEDDQCKNRGDKNL